MVGAWMIPALASGGLAAGDYQFDLTVGGAKRLYVLHVPPHTDQQLLPIVMMLHGAGGTARNAARSYGWCEKADAEAFVAVFPQGLPVRPNRPAWFLTNPNVWNDLSGRTPGPRNQIDDIAFLSAVLDDVQNKCNIDRRRIYVTGFSNGASMSFTVASRMADRVAAVGPVSGHFWPHAEAATRAVPLMLVVGTDDPLNPIDGGLARNPWGPKTNKPPMQQDVDMWLKHIGAPAAPYQVDDRGGILSRAYVNLQGCPMEYVVLSNQGHEWAGHQRVLPRLLTGPNRMDFNVTDQLWHFFQQQTLPALGPAGADLPVH